MASSIFSVQVPPSVWDWVLNIGDRERLSTSLSQEIGRWKTGIQLPTVDDIDTVSKRLRVPFGYFFLQTPIDDTPSVFTKRTLRSEESDETPSRDLVDTVNEMLNIQDWARQDQIAAGDEPLSFVGSMMISNGVSEIVRSMRRILELSEGWFDDGKLSDAKEAFTFLRSRAERAKIIVMMNGVVGENTTRKLNPKEFRAFALIDEYAPLVFINRADEPITARLFSLVHEFVHVWLGDEELFNDKQSPRAVSKIEQICNATAAEILMPDSMFTNCWEKIAAAATIEERLRAVRERFPVSSSAVLLRALNHHLIGKQQYNQGIEKAREWVNGESVRST
jgi:Zn-dependent peptidase ImmA (M78 family)